MQEVASEDNIAKNIEEKLNRRKKYLKDKYFVNDIKIYYIRKDERKRRRPMVDLVAEFEKPISLLDLVRLEDYLSRVLKVNASVTTKKAIETYLSKLKAEL